MPPSSSLSHYRWQTDRILDGIVAAAYDKTKDHDLTVKLQKDSLDRLNAVGPRAGMGLLDFQTGSDPPHYNSEAEGLEGSEDHTARLGIMQRWMSKAKVRLPSSEHYNE